MLIVEDGSIVPSADSYTSLTDARVMADKFGWVLPEDDGEAEAALRNGAAYIDLQESILCGTRVSAEQSLAFPRNGLNVYGFPVANNTIPKQVIQAQIAAAVEYGKGYDVRGSTDGRITTMERVEGAVTVQYADNGVTGSTITITAALDALKPLICGGGNNGFQFRVQRG
ncbi:hypothetical protein D3C80_262650 [compost metagenome]